jgi:hypothetical protein
LGTPLCLQRGAGGEFRKHRMTLLCGCLFIPRPPRDLISAVPLQALCRYALFAFIPLLKSLFSASFFHLTQIPKFIMIFVSSNALTKIIVRTSLGHHADHSESFDRFHCNPSPVS